MHDGQLLRGRRILIVEDDFLVAHVVAEELADAGAETLGPIGWLDEALGFLGREGASVDAVVLDVNLHGQTSYPIADALAACGVAFVFVSGYGRETLDDAYREFPHCIKPFQAGQLVATLSRAVG